MMMNEEHILESNKSTVGHVIAFDDLITAAARMRVAKERAQNIEKLVTKNRKGQQLQNITAEANAIKAIIYSGLAGPNDVKSWEELDIYDQKEVQKQYRLANKTPDYLIYDKPADVFSINPPQMGTSIKSINSQENIKLTAEFGAIYHLHSKSFRAILDKWEKYGSETIAIASINSLPTALGKKFLNEAFQTLKSKRVGSEGLWLTRGWDADKIL